ncbi:MAG: glycosyltransferase, partial [Proteobacteria bacterium]|nr:glycosyltransferase [Pseudomonadota bacterium]
MLRRWFFIPDDRVLWAPFALVRSLRVIREGKYDLIWVGAPPYSAGVIGYLVSRMSGLPLVVDLRDPWTSDPYFQSPSAIHRWLNRAFERRTLMHARKVVVISNEMKRNLLRSYNGFPESKIEVITNGFDSEEMAKVEPAPTGED